MTRRPGQPQVFEDSLSGDVARRSDDRSGGMAPRARGVETVHGYCDRQPIGKTERVVDVMNVSEGHPEVLLDALRMKHEPVDDEVRKARRKSVAYAEEVIDVAPLFGLP